MTCLPPPSRVLPQPNEWADAKTRGRESMRGARGELSPHITASNRLLRRTPRPRTAAPPPHQINTAMASTCPISDTLYAGGVARLQLLPPRIARTGRSAATQLQNAERISPPRRDREI